MNPVGEKIMNLLFPPVCPWCGELLRQGERHTKCEAALPRVENPICTLCGRGTDRCTCGARKSELRRVVSPFYYEGGVEDALKRFKYAGASYAARPLAKEMARTVTERLRGVPISAVAPVPMERAKQRRRGYNQAALLAKGLAKELGLPCEERLLRLTGDKQEQHTLDRAARAANVFGVYSVPHPERAAGRTILLVDDISTTGATLRECAKMLSLAGAAAVYGCTAALVVAK